MKRFVAALMLLVIVPFPSSAGEVLFIDLTGVTPRVQLRFPPPPPPRCDASGHCVSGGASGGSVGDCGMPGPGWPQALRIAIVQIDSETLRAGARAGYEVRIENIGKATMSIPVYPHLADLQPADPAEPFSVHQLDLGLRIGRGGQILGALSLYSSTRRPETSIDLHPGDWLRVRNTFALSQPVPASPESSGQATVVLTPYFVLRTSAHKPGFTSMSNECPYLDDSSTREVKLLPQ
jgi:hypothetical protein